MSDPLEMKWFTVDMPWGDGDWIVAGSPDPHAGSFIVSCEELENESTWDDEGITAHKVARRVVDDHNELKRYKKALGNLATEAEEHRFDYENRAGINRDEYWQGRRDEAGHFRDMAKEAIKELEEGA